MKQRNEILSELENMGSKLGHIPKQMPYNIPENYFQELEKKILAEIDNNSLLLDSIPKKLPYENPNDYFEKLPAALLKKVKENEQKKTKKFNINIWTKVRIAAAAALLIVSGISVFQYTQNRNSIEEKFAKIPQKEVQKYVQQKMIDMPNIDNMATASKKLPNEISENDIKQYLNETGWE